MLTSRLAYKRRLCTSSWQKQVQLCAAGSGWANSTGPSCFMDTVSNSLNSDSSVCWDVSRCYRTTHSKHKPAFTRVCAGFTRKWQVSTYFFELMQVLCWALIGSKPAVMSHDAAQCGVLPGSAADLRAWSRWASSRTSPRCACTGTYIPVFGSSWWASGCCPPWSRSGRCSPARCGKRTGGGRGTCISHHRLAVLCI